jgi:hypothetical protein
MCVGVGILVILFGKEYVLCIRKRKPLRISM